MMQDLLLFCFFFSKNSFRKSHGNLCFTDIAPAQRNLLKFQGLFYKFLAKYFFFRHFSREREVSKTIIVLTFFQAASRDNLFNISRIPPLKNLLQGFLQNFFQGSPLFYCFYRNFLWNYPSKVSIGCLRYIKSYNSFFSVFFQ